MTVEANTKCQGAIVQALTENGATAPEVDTDTLAERIWYALDGLAQPVTVEDDAPAADDAPGGLSPNWPPPPAPHEATPR